MTSESIVNVRLRGAKLRSQPSFGICLCFEAKPLLPFRALLSMRYCWPDGWTLVMRRTQEFGLARCRQGYSVVYLRIATRLHADGNHFIGSVSTLQEHGVSDFVVVDIDYC